MKNFILASRPKTLVLSVLPPFISYQYAHAAFGSSSWGLALLAMTSALMIQLATNYFNDLIDFQKGADLIRIGPVRVTSTGLVKASTVKKWAFTALGIAFLTGIPLIIKGGPVILILGIVSMYLAYGYTGGKLSLAYRGLGELFVFLFFGLFSVLGSIYIYAGKLDLNSVFIASAFGFLSMTFICINNLRDREEDLKSSKLTLATRMSYESYQLFLILTILLPHVLLFLACRGPAWSNLSLLPALFLIATVCRSKGEELNKSLKLAALHIIIFSAMVCLDIHYENIF
ncbi:MAG: 1,4-dihydroxy-2-naphthoate octaprenyltransferase [Bdellovibrionales bacterium]|nr:1,4-dihydroxy-2-naphthoate octaprenyltransferase [Oligoflexia bacterium]